MKKVLIAEDSSVIQNLAKKILEFQNFEIHSVKNGEQVLESLEKESFDIILLDINMPIMDGITATKLIKDLEKDNYKIPIIALTANSIAGDEEKYLAQGMNNYLSKPINADNLYEILLKWTKPIKKETNKFNSNFKHL